MPKLVDEGLVWREVHVEIARTLKPEGTTVSRSELVELFLDGRLDDRTVVRRLVADGIDATEARLLVQVLAARVVGPLPRWGAGAPVDGGDLYTVDPPENAGTAHAPARAAR